MIDIKEIYEQLCLRVPVKQYDADPTDFRGVLQRELKNYMTLLDWLRSDNMLTDDNVAEVGKTCKKLNDIVTSVYQGLHSWAFTQLSKGPGGQVPVSRNN